MSGGREVRGQEDGGADRQVQVGRAFDDGERPRFEQLAESALLRAGVLGQFGVGAYEDVEPVERGTGGPGPAAGDQVGGIRRRPGPEVMAGRRCPAGWAGAFIARVRAVTCTCIWYAMSPSLAPGSANRASVVLFPAGTTMAKPWSDSTTVWARRGASTSVKAVVNARAAACRVAVMAATRSPEARSRPGEAPSTRPSPVATTACWTPGSSSSGVSTHARSPVVEVGALTSGRLLGRPGRPGGRGRPVRVRMAVRRRSCR